MHITTSTVKKLTTKPKYFNNLVVKFNKQKVLFENSSIDTMKNTMQQFSSFFRF